MTVRSRLVRAGGAKAPPARRRPPRPPALPTTDFARIAKALADPTRFEILKLIAAEPEISCGQIVDRFALSQPAISHHLKLLGDAGVVTVRRAGKHGHFRLAPDVLDGFVAELRKRLSLR